MPATSVYLNFKRSTEQAFEFYRSVFGGEFSAPLQRMGEVPGERPLSDEDEQLVLHVAMILPGGLRILGTDAPDSIGFSLNKGSDVHLNLEPDTRVETERLFVGLSESGKISTPLQEMFWEDCFGSCTDKFGTNWIFNYADKK